MKAVEAEPTLKAEATLGARWQAGFLEEAHTSQSIDIRLLLLGCAEIYVDSRSFV